MNDQTFNNDYHPATWDDQVGHEKRMAQYDDTNAAMRAMLALDAGRMGSWSWDIAAGHVVGDPFVAKLLNLDFGAQPWPLEAVFAQMHPDDLDRVQAAVDEALGGKDLYEVEFRDTIVDPHTGREGLRWLGARGRVTEKNAKGEPLRMIGVNWDASLQKMQEERLAMLADEMDHRVKNAFAVIRALINVGARSSSGKSDFATTLRTQVEAMASAHALSAKMARQTGRSDAGSPISQLIKTALSPWIDSESNDRVQINVTSDFELPPRQVSAMSMLLYELATNAVKHGALGEAGGTVTVTAHCKHDGRPTVSWDEAVKWPLAPNTQDADDAHGFGSVLIRNCISTLGAKLDRSITNTGLQISVTLQAV